METLIAKLNEAGVRYVAIGGQAVRLHGMPRFSLDWDLLVPARVAELVADAPAGRGGFDGTGHRAVRIPDGGAGPTSGDVNRRGTRPAAGRVPSRGGFSGFCKRLNRRRI